MSKNRKNHTGGNEGKTEEKGDREVGGDEPVTEQPVASQTMNAAMATPEAGPDTGEVK